MFHKYGKTVKFPRNPDVDIHVREVTLNADAPTEQQVEAIEIREWLKGGEVYGHGLVIPRDLSLNVVEALKKIGAA